MGLDIHGEAIAGKRDYQEDYFEICAEAVESPDGCLVVLCDGMGGHSGGAIASRLVATKFIDKFLSSKGVSPAEAFEAALNNAHDALREEVAQNAAPAD